MSIDTDANRDQPTELVLAVVCPVGADKSLLARIIKNRLSAYDYRLVEIKVSQIIQEIAKIDTENTKGELERISTLMNHGNRIRQSTRDNATLAKLAAGQIRLSRAGNPDRVKIVRVAYLINSIKHPDEVYELRKIYGDGFFLFALHSDVERRSTFLKERDRGARDASVAKLIARDESEDKGHGQNTRDAFHLADFFVHYDGDEDKLSQSVDRAIKLIFGHPYLTPTFNEYAMFTAYTSSLRSADLSRQVGAVVAVDEEIIALGANDCPRFGGGLYWPQFDQETKSITDFPLGRDHTRGYDSNERRKREMKSAILARLSRSVRKSVRRNIANSGLDDIIEFSRAVHAEMEALLACARRGISTANGVLFSTTLPCHNCAKHILAAGIKKVVFVEPYPKSRTFEMHDEATTYGSEERTSKLLFRPFIGVGPRSFISLFSLRLGSGTRLVRKRGGNVIAWDPLSKVPRLKMLPASYLQLEDLAATKAARAVKTYSRKED